MLDVCEALEKGDYETVGKRMYETHWGMSKDYEVSCEELDFLAEVAEACGVTGSRIMGGGFGGFTTTSSLRPKRSSTPSTAMNPKSMRW